MADAELFIALVDDNLSHDAVPLCWLYFLNVPTEYLKWLALRRDSELHGWLEIWIPNIVSAPVSITSPGPRAHLFLVQFPITLLENGGKRCEVALNLEKILIRDLLPLRLQRCPELLPELSKLFLIHEKPPLLCNGRPNLLTAQCRTLA